MPIALPGPDAVPAGPRRDLVMRLHTLYGQAGKPATRIISKRINDDTSAELESVSHETINSTLRGRSVPSWAKLRSIIVVLCRMSEQQVDYRRQLVEFNSLWLRAESFGTAQQMPPDVGVRPQIVRSSTTPLPVIAPGATVALPQPPAEPVEPWVHGTLPERSRLFAGRESVLDEIKDRLARSPGTPLILYGPIGAGKTQLAAEYVRTHRGDYTITWWVRADNVDQARDSLSLLAQRLGVAAADTQRRSVDQLFDLLEQSGPYLIVFDGVVSGDIRTMIRTRGGSVIVTTRNAGWARESRHDGFEVPDLDDSECAQLLRKHDPGITAPEVARLVAVAGRSPLGLVAACHLHPGRVASSWTGLADRLADPANRVLTDPAGPPPEAVETVRSSLRDRVIGDPDLPPLLTLLLGFGPDPVRLWMLQGGAGGDVSAGVRRVLGNAGGLKRALDMLAAAGLARREAAGEWIEIPAFVRLVLRELVPASRGEVNRRDVVEILVLADPGRPDDRRKGVQHQAIMPHVRPAGLVEWFRPSAYRTVHNQIRFLFLIGDLEAAQRLGREAEAALSRQSALAPTDELVLQIKRDLANALRADGSYADAYRLTEEAMTLITADPVYSSDDAIALDLARSRGHDLRIAGRFQEAYEHDEATNLLHLAALQRDDLRCLASHYNLSVSRRFLGRYLEAAEDDRAGLDRLRGDRSGDDRRQSRLTNALAEDLYGLGRYEDLVDLLAQLLAEESGRELQRARRMTAVAFRRLGHLVPAVEQLGVCYQACLHQMGERRELTLATGMSFGNALREMGQFDTALHYCGQAAEGY
ncbi:FxSxx-COOH system tetratricopeptide repeat protein, partial [Actinoplanes sp. NPDC051633]|uniref:FxSxx-COOH system tetratricopeptide repeat protein n=1 Tax=Actinoplanes sp. NPDC051633 TaxID=3155670 RepID=UPI003419EBCC